MCKKLIVQTFSASSVPDWSQVPICVHGSAPQLTAQLSALASKLSPHIYLVDDEQRLALHVAAVFVNNFGNHLFSMAAQICSNEGVSFDILKPLMTETLAKVQRQLPQNVQTGPAVRNDVPTIQRHLLFLESYPEAFRVVYKAMTEGIMQEANLKNNLESGTGTN